MSLHTRLLEEDALLRIKTSREKIQKKLPDVVAKGIGMLVVRRESMPVGNEEKTIMPILELDPVSQGPHVVAQMQSPGGLDSTYDSPDRNLRLVFHTISLACFSQCRLIHSVPIN